MRRWVGPGTALLLATALSIVAALAAHRGAPAPSADASRATDEAFSTGPYRTRISSTGPQRWTGRHDVLRFERLGGEARVVEVGLRHHQAPVEVAAAGIRLGVVAPGATSAAFTLPSGVGDRVEVELRTDIRPGAPPGAMVERVMVRHDRGWWPPVSLIALFVVAGVGMAGGALAGRVAPLGAIGIGAVALALTSVLLVPSGVLRSPWAPACAAIVGFGGLAAGGIALVVDRRRPGAGPWAFAAGFVTLIVQGVLATTPLLPVSDALFHAHKLGQVAGGDLFPVSVTQHATPFRFPYGVSFYLLLAPFARAGLDPLALVRGGAALSGVVASAALFGVLLPRGVAAAGLATIALQLLPITFDVYSYGNLSNVFGQSVTVLFFAWWAGSARGGWAAGAALVAVGALAHFSSFVVLGVLAGALALVRWRAAELDRARVIAILVGLGAASAYYLSFLPLVLSQLGRLGEGAGTGRVRRGLLAEAWDELLWLRIRWGLPAIVLGALGRPRPKRGRLDRDAVAFWAAGALLAVLALTTPVEVRYVYALTLPLAVAVADGLHGLAGRGRVGVAAAIALAAAQAVVAGRAILEALVERYR